MEIQIDKIYSLSENVIAREIEGELIIVPLNAGIGDVEDEMYSLNDTGKEIWQLLDRKNSVQDIYRILSKEYDADPGEIKQDILGLIEELVRRGFIVENHI